MKFLVDLYPIKLDETEGFNTCDRKCEDPDFWRTVRDPSTGQDVRLSKEDLELIHRIREGHVPDPNHDEYQV